jgi:hypothetical protein
MKSITKKVKRGAQHKACWRETQQTKDVFFVLFCMGFAKRQATAREGKRTGYFSNVIRNVSVVWKREGITLKDSNNPMSNKNNTLLSPPSAIRCVVAFFSVYVPKGLHGISRYQVGELNILFWREDNTKKQNDVHG